MPDTLPRLEPEDYLRSMRSSSVYNVAIKTPLEFAPQLSARAGCRVLLKREDMQPVRSFKLRGAYQKMSKLAPEAFRRGVIAASAGNHAQGVALAAQELCTSALIVVPVPTPAIKQQAIRDLGAELVVSGDNYDDAYAHARRLAEELGREFIHPYDDPDVIIGQGTIGLEILEAYPQDIDAIFLPVGGGGLISGVALAVKQIRPGTKIIGVETNDSNAMELSLKLGKRVTLPTVGMLADGCAVRTVGELTFRLAKEWVDDIVTVSNDALCAAVQDIFEDRRAIVEPSGALAYAGLLAYGMNPNSTAVAVVSGANLNFERLNYIAEMARVGRQSEAIFAVHIPERPGSFKALCTAIGERNLTEFNYRLGNATTAVVFVGLRVSGRADREEVKKHLESEGFETIDLTDDEVAKMHVRHMIGGRIASDVPEHLLRLEFPERPGALAGFLERLAARWNISLFHYRNHGSDRGRALIGFQVPDTDKLEFHDFVAGLGDAARSLADNSAIQLFL